MHSHFESPTAYEASTVGAADLELLANPAYDFITHDLEDMWTSYLDPEHMFSELRGDTEDITIKMP
jgi:hypothetical protein